MTRSRDTANIIPTVDAKGDLIVGSADNTVAKLAVGAEGTVLLADPSTATGLAWGAAGGSISVSTTAPEDPEEGDLWFNSANATTYIYYDSFWVELSEAKLGPTGPAGEQGAAGPEGPQGPQFTPTTSDKSAGYTIQASDVNSYIRSTGSAITITVPDVLTNGQSVNFIQAGAGQITFAESGITINSKDSKLKTAAQFSGASIVKAGGAYYLIGDLGV
jgi:hypothetical protein